MLIVKMTEEGKGKEGVVKVKLNSNYLAVFDFNLKKLVNILQAKYIFDTF